MSTEKPIVTYARRQSPGDQMDEAMSMVLAVRLALAGDLSMIGNDDLARLSEVLGMAMNMLWPVRHRLQGVEVAS